MVVSFQTEQDVDTTQPVVTKGKFASLLRSAYVQVWVENATTPTFTFKLYGRLRKERVEDASHEPPWIELVSITNATAAADRLAAVTKRVDEVKAEITGYTGPGKVFAVVSAENIGGQR